MPMPMPMPMPSPGIAGPPHPYATSPAMPPPAGMMPTLPPSNLNPPPYPSNYGHSTSINPPPPYPHSSYPNAGYPQSSYPYSSSNIPPLPPGYNSSNNSHGSSNSIFGKVSSFVAPAATAGAAYYGAKKLKKGKLKKAMKYGLPIAGVGLGTYALSKAFHHSSSSSSSSDSD